jgi:hypothetical protein
MAPDQRREAMARLNDTTASRFLRLPWNGELTERCYPIDYMVERKGLALFGTPS